MNKMPHPIFSDGAFLCLPKSYIVFNGVLLTAPEVYLAADSQNLSRKILLNQ